MDKEEQVRGNTEDNIGRRKFFKHISKYFVGFGAFAMASLFGLKRDGEISLGKMKSSEFGLSEASGKCGYSSDCSGGGGNCGYSSDCSGGGGKCGYSSDCSGGGGKCGYSSNCAGE